MDVSGERYVSPVPRVWDRPRPFYGWGGVCVCVHVHAYTGLRRRGWFVETMHSILFHHRKGPTVQPRLPRRYLGGRGYIMLFSFSFEFFAAHKYYLLIHDLFSRMVTRFGLFGEFFSWSWGG